MAHAVQRLVPLLFALALAGCGESEDITAPPPAGGPNADTTAAPDVAPAAAVFPRKAAPDGASVYIIAPEDGAVVSNPVRVVFGLRGMGVAPAGVPHAEAGHHHLLVDVEPESFDAPIPADDNHIHFGLGQTEAEVTLQPGERRLQLLLGDELHVPHDPPLLSEPITITVE